MASNKYQIKDTQFFDWASEPVDERPSEFSTTASSGYGPVPNRQRAEAPTGMNLMWLTAVAVLVVGGIGLYGLIHLLKH